MVELIGSGDVESRVVALERAAEPFGTRIRRLRLDRGLSLRSLAMRLGCDHSLVVRWERGDREPAPQDLARLARVLRVTADELLAGADLGCGRVASSRSHGQSSRERLGGRIRILRRRSSITPWDVFVSAGIDGRRLRTIEAGADPSLAELRKIAGLLGASVGHLLMGAPEPPGAPAPLFLSRAEAARVLGIGPTTLSVLITEGRLPAVQLRARVLIPAGALKELADELEAEAAQRAREVAGPPGRLRALPAGRRALGGGCGAAPRARLEAGTKDVLRPHAA